MEEEAEAGAGAEVKLSSCPLRYPRRAEVEEEEEVEAGVAGGEAAAAAGAGAEVKLSSCPLRQRRQPQSRRTEVVASRAFVGHAQFGHTSQFLYSRLAQRGI